MRQKLRSVFENGLLNWTELYEEDNASNEQIRSLNNKGKDWMVYSINKLLMPFTTPKYVYVLLLKACNILQQQHNPANNTINHNTININNQQYR